MIYTANQTLFFPQVYMIDRFVNSDVIVLMKEAQFTKFGHQSRTSLMTKNGEILSSVPLSDRSFKALKDVLVFEPKKWFKKFKTQLQTIYGRCYGFRFLSESLFNRLDTVTSFKDLSIATLDRAIMEWVLMVLNIDAVLIDSIDLIGPRDPDPTEWLIKMGKAVGAGIYLCGAVSCVNYLKTERFYEEGIKLKLQDYTYPGLPDVTGTINCNGQLSILDPLMVNGPDDLISIGLGRFL